MQKIAPHRPPGQGLDQPNPTVRIALLFGSAAIGAIVTVMTLPLLGQLSASSAGLR